MMDKDELSVLMEDTYKLVETQEEILEVLKVIKRSLEQIELNTARPRN